MDERTQFEDAKRRLDAAHKAFNTGDGHRTLLEAATEYIRVLQTMVGEPKCLTPRERQVLRLIAAGKSSREVAADLGMAFKTVVVHRHRIYRKLKIHKSVDVVRAAMGV